MALDRQCLRLSSLKTTQVGEAYRIAISANRGAHWTFVDSGNDEAAGKQKLRILFPAAADKLKFAEINARHSTNTSHKKAQKSQGRSRVLSCFAAANDNHVARRI